MTETPILIDIRPQLEQRAQARLCRDCRPHDGYRCAPHRCALLVAQLRRDLADCTAGALVVSVADVEEALSDSLAELEHLAATTVRTPPAIDINGSLVQLGRTP